MDTYRIFRAASHGWSGLENLSGFDEKTSRYLQQTLSNLAATSDSLGWFFPIPYDLPSSNSH